MQQTGQYVISYDIAVTKSRTRIAEVLKNVGVRVQKSVFECRLTGQELLQIKQQLTELIDPKSDSVLFYRVCGACFRQMDAIGKPIIREPDDFLIL